MSEHAGAQPDILYKDGRIEGPARAPRNTSQGQADSIHTDAVARPLGFRGGLVTGAEHLSQFVPLLLAAFGPAWFERGGLSLYFRNATLDGEAVRASVGAPSPGASDAQVDAVMDRVADGLRVMDGTAFLGRPTTRTGVQRAREKYAGGGETRILSALRAGIEGRPVESAIPIESQEDWLATATEPHDWYRHGSPWGRPVVSPTLLVRLLTQSLHGLPHARFAVALFGAIEIQFLAGPIMVDMEYTMRGRVLATGETPKSEYLWFESLAAAEGESRPIARMVMMMRYMKQSSPLWTAG